MAFVVAWICQRLLSIFDTPIVLVAGLVVALLMGRIMFSNRRRKRNG